jgi:hypothetical protein
MSVFVEDGLLLISLLSCVLEFLYFSTLFFSSFQRREESMNSLAKIDGNAEKLVYLLIKLGNDTPKKICRANISRSTVMRGIADLIKSGFIIKNSYGHYLNCITSDTPSRNT